MPTDWGGGAGADIGRTLLELGRIRGENSVQQGNIWGHAIANIGNTIENAPLIQMRQQEMQARTAELQGLADDRRMKMLAMQREQQGSQALAKAIGDPANEGDPEKVYRAVAGMGYPEQGQKFLDAATKHSEALQKLTVAKGAEHQAVADLLDGADPTDTAGIQARLGLAHTRGVDTAPYAQLLDQLGPEQGLKQIIDSAPENVKAGRTRKEKAAEEAAKPTVVPEGAGVFQGGQMVVEPTPKAASMQSENVLLDGKPAKVNFNPKKGTYTDTSGQDVSPRVKPMPPASVVYPNPQGDQAVRDVKETVSGMKDGSIPPILPSRASKEYTALMAEAHRQGVNLVKANEDWNATQKYLGTLNGQQQVRLRQAVQFTKDSLPIVETLAQQWDAGKYGPLNKARLVLAKGGALGQDAQGLATKLDAQIADLTSELGTVYKGGNSSTDESLTLAAKNLSANWSKQTLLDNVTQIRQNLAIRENSIRAGAPIANEGNAYAPTTAPAAAAQGPPPGAKVRVWNPATGRLE